MPPNTVYVGDPSRWGNPFHGQIREIGREAVVGLYAGYLAAYFGFTDRMVLEAFRGLPVQSTDFDEWIAPLRGKNLACWCPTSAPCHADVLLEIANR